MTYIKVHYIPLLFCGCGSGNCNSVVFISDNTSSSSPPSCHSPFPEMGRSSPSCSSFPEMGRSSPSCSSFPEMGRSLFPVCNLFLVASCFDLLLFSLAVDNSGLGYKLIIIINKLLLSP